MVGFLFETIVVGIDGGAEQIWCIYKD